jgi:hypothetical protein
VVYDKETLSDDVIGRFDIPLPSLALGTGEVAYNLVHPNDFKKVAGCMCPSLPPFMFVSACQIADRFCVVLRCDVM